MSEPRWAVGSNQYRLRARPQAPEPVVDLSADWARGSGVRLETLGLDLSAIRPSEPDRARARMRAQLPELVWNAAALEGNTFTLPEVRTLLEGVTVGGRPVRDAEQILALSEAYNHLDDLLGAGEFTLSKDVSDALHAMLARHEAIEAGHFRGEGSVTGGGHVRLADGTRSAGLDHGAGGSVLLARFEDIRQAVARQSDPRTGALLYMAAATRSQLYFDGNKRTARLMTTGLLISAGFDGISVPNARRAEFNLALDEMFTTDDATGLVRFLATCSVD